MEKWLWIANAIQVAFKDESDVDKAIYKCKKIQKDLDELGYRGETLAWKREFLNYNPTNAYDILKVAMSTKYCTACEIAHGDCSRCHMQQGFGCSNDVTYITSWLIRIKNKKNYQIKEENSKSFIEKIRGIFNWIKNHF